MRPPLELREECEHVWRVIGGYINIADGNHRSHLKCEECGTEKYEHINHFDVVFAHENKNQESGQLVQ